MRAIISWTIVALMLGVASVEGAKDTGPKPRLPDDKLFKDQAAFCEGCYGLVHEIHKLMTMWAKEKGSLEDVIDTAMVAVCSTDRLRAYVLSPPKMERLCSGIRAHYEDELGLALLKNYGKKNPDVDKVFADTCVKAIPACPKNMKPMSVGRKEQREKDDAERAAKASQSDNEKDEDTKKEQVKKADKEKDTKNTKKSTKKEQVKKADKEKDTKNTKKSTKSKAKTNKGHKKDEL